MRTRTFFLVAALGTIAKVTIVYYLGDWLSAPLHDIADFVGQYQWYLTPVTFAVVALQLLSRRRKNRLPIETVDEFERDLEDRSRASATTREPGGYGVDVGFVSQSRVSAALHEKPWPPIPVPSRGS